MQVPCLVVTFLEAIDGDPSPVFTVWVCLHPSGTCTQNLSVHHINNIHKEAANQRDDDPGALNTRPQDKHISRVPPHSQTAVQGQPGDDVSAEGMKYGSQGPTQVSEVPGKPTEREPTPTESYYDGYIRQEQRYVTYGQHLKVPAKINNE